MKKLIFGILLVSNIFLNFPANANTLHVLEDTIYNMTLQDWLNYSNQQKLIFCVGVIKSMTNNNVLNIQVNDKNIQQYANELKSPIDFLANNTSQKSDSLFFVILASIEKLGWIKLNSISDKPKENQNSVIFDTPYTQQSHTTTNKSTDDKVNKKIVQATTKRRIPNKKNGRAWVKKNIFVSSHFALSELEERLGEYEKTIDYHYKTFTLEKYYFKYVDITFLVMQNSNNLFGYIFGKMR